MNRITIVALCVGCIAGSASAQTLEGFRKATSSSSSSAKKSEKRKKSKTRDSNKDSYRYRDNDDDDSFGDRVGRTVLEPVAGWILELPFLLARYGGEASFLRAHEKHPELPPGLQPREPGDLLLPMVRLDANYQRVDGRTDGLDLRLEGGYGPLAAEWRRTEFTEDLDDGGEDSLVLDQIMARWRMTVTDHVELGFGVGAGKTDAADATYKPAGQLSARFMHESRLGVEWRGAWIETAGRSISDQDLAVLYHFDHIALRAGNRWIDAGPAVLHGPHIGIALSW